MVLLIHKFVGRVLEKSAPNKIQTLPCHDILPVELPRGVDIRCELFAGLMLFRRADT